MGSEERLPGGRLHGVGDRRGIGGGRRDGGHGLVGGIGRLERLRLGHVPVAAVATAEEVVERATLVQHHPAGHGTDQDHERHEPRQDAEDSPASAFLHPVAVARRHMGQTIETASHLGSSERAATDD